MDLVDCLISEFETCLDYFEQYQAERFKPYPYINTMKLRNERAEDAIDNDEFLTSLHRTLSGWWRLGRAGYPSINLSVCFVNTKNRFGVLSSLKLKP